MITIYSTQWCGDCIRTKAFLKEKGIKFIEINIEEDSAAISKVKEINQGNTSVPTVIFEDGSTMTEPSNQELAEKLKIS